MVSKQAAKGGINDREVSRDGSDSIRADIYQRTGKIHDGMGIYAFMTACPSSERRPLRTESLRRSVYAANRNAPIPSNSMYDAEPRS